MVVFNHTFDLIILEVVSNFNDSVILVYDCGADSDPCGDDRYFGKLTEIKLFLLREGQLHLFSLLTQTSPASLT